MLNLLLVSRGIDLVLGGRCAAWSYSVPGSNSGTIPAPEVQGSLIALAVLKTLVGMVLPAAVGKGWR